MSKINKEQKRKLKKQLRKLQKSFCKINTILSQDCGGVYIEVNKKFDRMYPFDKSFDEMTLEVDEWIEDMYPSLKIIKGTAIYTGGGIYIVVGKLNDGNYIITDEQSIGIVADNPMEEDDDLSCDYHYSNINWIIERDLLINYKIENLLKAIKKFCKDLDNGKGDEYLIDEFKETDNYMPGELMTYVYESLKRSLKV